MLARRIFRYGLLGGRKLRKDRLQRHRPLSNLSADLDKSSGIAILTMNKRPVNSMDQDFLTDIKTLFDELEKDAHCRGVVVTSDVPFVFCAGLDVKVLLEKEANDIKLLLSALRELWMKIYGTSLATVAAINGHSPAGGCILAMACDYRIMLPHFRIGLSEALLGIPFPFWLRDGMSNIIGHRETEKALQLGLLYTAEEALKVGLIDKVSEHYTIQSDAREHLQRMLDVSDQARQQTKEMLRRTYLDKMLQADDDLGFFADYICSEQTQGYIRQYLNQFKKQKNKS